VAGSSPVGDLLPPAASVTRPGNEHEKAALMGKAGPAYLVQGKEKESDGQAQAAPPPKPRRRFQGDPATVREAVPADLAAFCAGLPPGMKPHHACRAVLTHLVQPAPVFVVGARAACRALGFTDIAIDNNRVTLGIVSATVWGRRAGDSHVWVWPSQLRVVAR
jgi:hypothetical protein